MIYVVLQNKQRIYFSTIDALFDYVNTHDDIHEGWIGA